MPGSLDVADLPRLCPPGRDVFVWAEEHLRAVTDKPYPTLVPARGVDGACHWLFEGRCAVHAEAPYSCAFFDTHMTAEDAACRSAATVRTRLEDREQNGLYFRVWLHLKRQGLTTRSGDHAALGEELGRLRRTIDRQLRQRQTP